MVNWDELEHKLSIMRVDRYKDMRVDEEDARSQTIDTRETLKSLETVNESDNER